MTQNRTFRHVVFMQGDDGRQVVDALTRTEGVVVHGATDATIADAMALLAERDDHTGVFVMDTPGSGDRDLVAERDFDGITYRLTWNAILGYVGLEEVITTEVQA